MVLQWPLIAFKLFGTLGGALLVFCALDRLCGLPARTESSLPQAKRYTLVVIVAALAIAIVAGFFQLGKPSALMSMLRGIGSGSFVGMEVAAFMLLCLLAAVYVYLCIKGSGACRILGVAAAIVALLFMGMTGLSYQLMVGMPAWHTPAIPFGFLVGGLAAGGFSYGAIWAFSARNEHGGQIARSRSSLGKILLVLSVLSCLTYAAYGLAVDLSLFGAAYAIVVAVCCIAMIASSMVYLLLGKKLVSFAAMGAVASIAVAVMFRISIYFAVGNTLPVIVRSLGA